MFFTLSAAQAQADPQSIRQVISDQLKAFQSDNGALAFSFASPSIKRIFRNPDNFMAMVREGYAPVYRPAKVEFRDLSIAGSQMVQRVYIRGDNGEAVMATYTLIQLDDGSWKISGCQIEKLPEFSA